ncbi:MAG TPA: DUF6220 domain-containing protein [Longimicrobiaceae bacterium]|nr:DUF6220 domain-containing protein [Longimicrobiaceae bacterium]
MTEGPPRDAREAPAGARRPLRRWDAPAARAVRVGAWLFLAAIGIQVFLAGMGVFSGPLWWARHRAFVHAFEWTAPLLLILAFSRALPRRARVLALLLNVLLFAQYATVGSLPVLLHSRAVSALHPVGALLLFWTALSLAKVPATPGPGERRPTRRDPRSAPGA